ELHMTVDQREQRVVLAESDVLTGEELRAALTHQDVSGTHALTAETLHAEALGVRLAVVPRRGLTFFVSHGALLEGDGGHAHARLDPVDVHDRVHAEYSPEPVHRTGSARITPPSRGEPAEA